MMIILSKKEYDALILRADSSESKVEMRVEEEKRKILEQVKARFKAVETRTLRQHPIELCRQIFDELLR